MGNIEIERDVAPAEAAYRLLEPIGSRHHRLEPVFACGHFPVEYIVALHRQSSGSNSDGRNGVQCSPSSKRSLKVAGGRYGLVVHSGLSALAGVSPSSSASPQRIPRTPPPY